MDPADSRVATEEGSLTQLWGYCQSVTQAVDPHMRHIQVVFFDNYLSSTTFSTSFLDIDKLIQIITELRASSSFELFGLGCPGKEDAAASLAALAAWFFLHRRRVFPPPLAAHLFDPPLQGRRRPAPSPLVSSASSESAAKGPAAPNHTAALLPGRLVESQPSAPAPASSKKRRSRRRRSSPQPDFRTSQQSAVGEEGRGKKSILDVDPEAQALMEITGKTMHSQGLREPEDDQE